MRGRKLHCHTPSQSDKTANCLSPINGKGANTMTFPQIRRLVDSLMLKYADEVEARRLRPVAQRFCEDLARAVTGKKPGRPRSIGEWTQIFLRRAQERRLPTPGPRLSQRLPGSLPRPSRPAPGQRAPARPAPQGRSPRHHPPRPRSPHPLLNPPFPSFLRRQESRERTTEESGRLATVSALDSCLRRNDEAELRNSYPDSDKYFAQARNSRNQG